MRDVAAERGYSAASVARVLDRAGLSRAVFYECFEGREECFAAAYGEAVAQLLDLAGRRAEAEPSAEAVASLIGEVLDWASESPASARIVLVEVHAATTAVRRDHHRNIARLIRATEDFLASHPASGRAPRIPALGLLGGIVGSLEAMLFGGAVASGAERSRELGSWLEGYSIEAEEGLPDFDRWRKVFSLCNAPPLPAEPPGSPALLPRGRGALPAERCAAQRRERIFEATARAVASKGFGAATVADIAAEARVSRAIFYSHFKSKEGAFLFAQETFFKRGIAALASEYYSAREWPERVWRGLAALLRYFAERPALASLAVLEAKAAGPTATRRSLENRGTYALLLEEGFRHSRRPSLPAISTSGASACAIHALVWRQVALGRVEETEALLPESAYIALAPFIGAAEAARFIEAKVQSAAQAPAGARQGSSWSRDRA